MAQYTSLKDMFDGGGAGVAGGKFKGGGLISALGNMLFNRQDAPRQMAPMQTARPVARPASGFTGIGGEPVMQRPVARPVAAAQPVAQGPQGPVQNDLTSILAASAARNAQTRDLGLNTQRQQVNDLGSLLAGGGPAVAPMGSFDAMFPPVPVQGQPLGFDPLVPASNPNWDSPAPKVQIQRDRRGRLIG